MDILVKIDRFQIKQNVLNLKSTLRTFNAFTYFCTYFLLKIFVIITIKLENATYFDFQNVRNINMSIARSYTYRIRF